MDLGVAPTHRRAVDDPLGSKVSGAIRTWRSWTSMLTQVRKVTMSRRAAPATHPRVGCWRLPMTRATKYTPATIHQAFERSVVAGVTRGTRRRGSWRRHDRDASPWIGIGQARRPPESCSIGNSSTPYVDRSSACDVGGGVGTSRRTGPVRFADGRERSVFAQDPDRRHGSGAEGKASSAHEPEPRRIGEPRSGSERVLDDPAPHRNGPDDADLFAKHSRHARGAPVTPSRRGRTCSTTQERFPRDVGGISPPWPLWLANGRAE